MHIIMHKWMPENSKGLLTYWWPYELEAKSPIFESRNQTINLSYKSGQKIRLILWMEQTYTLLVVPRKEPKVGERI